MVACSASTNCCCSLFQALPDDVFTFITQFLTPRDVCALTLCCRSLAALAASEKVWFGQCEALGVVGSRDLVDWRSGVASYKALCKFIFSVRPLIGIWVHQNPELGNVVYVMPGYVSVVGCRVIPQELGPLGLQEGPLLWAPVFEVIGDFDGSVAFFLHGRERDGDYVYPGSLRPVDKDCNVLLLEVEPRKRGGGGKLLHSKSVVHCDSDWDLSRHICRYDKSGISRSQRVVGQSNSVVSFSRLAFADRRKLLEVVTSDIRLKIPISVNGLMFPGLRMQNESFRKDIVHLTERRLVLMQMYKLGGACVDFQDLHRMPINLKKSESSRSKKSLHCQSNLCGAQNGNEGHLCRSRRSVSGLFKDSLKLILGRSYSLNGNHEISRSGSSSSESKHAQLNEFLRSGDTIGLTLHASTMRLSTYRAWPNMHDNRFALYKLPMQLPKAGKDYAGLWGGTFGWPPGRITEDKSGKALFFLLLSYELSEGQCLLIATKILEGTHYVLHPNGSAMFVVKIDEISSDPFPWKTDGDSIPVDVKQAYNGEGIANGYGFRYPGAKPGSLFVIQNGTLAFVWKESRAVLTLQRLDLEVLLKKGERIPALPPILNFAYLTKSHSNVFTGFSSPRCAFLYHKTFVSQNIALLLA
ncbi:hypothetical protein Syun_014290 [Stephania yunnanensis]|uniref:F-box domain-containing protein n=1 Tax=Stephania yunnanensis TaxID=152371 RepID=A0AAP0JJU5_9MAGN